MQNLTNNSRNANRNEVLVTLAMVVALVLGALVSATALADHFSSPQAYSYQIEKLDEKRDTVMGMCAATTTASAIISAVPGDTGTPIANELAKVSRGLGIVLGAIFLEKCCLTICGLALFRVTIPCCCVLLICARLARRNEERSATLRKLAAAFMLVAGIAWASVPVSIVVTDSIEETHRASIEASINSAEEMNNQLNNAGEDVEDKTLVHKVYDFFFGSGSDSAADNALAKVTERVEWAKTFLINLGEGFAVMVVTTCVIPFLVLVAIYLVARLTFRVVSK